MKLIGVMLSAAIGLLVSLPAEAQEACGKVEEVCCGGAPECCAHCGSRTPCKKYCRVVKETKVIEKTVWEVKCEDFCLPRPRMFGGCYVHPQACDGECGQCDADSCENCGEKSCDACDAVRKAYADCVAPFCGPVRAKKTLVPRKVKCEVTVFKCEVVYCCSAKCYTERSGEPAPEKSTPAPDAAPAPPANDAVPAPPAPAAMAAPLPPVIGTTYTLPVED